MPQIFPKKSNLLPHVSLGALMVSGVIAVFLVWYYFSPEYTDVGYAPEQPVSYSHRVHVDQLGLDCRYCHSFVEVADMSNVPATETCMNCHEVVLPQSSELMPVRASWADGSSIPWVKIHQLPDYAHFSHAAHVNNGVGCETCHGRVDNMDVVHLVEPLSMGWCLECHREPEKYLRPNEEITTMGYVHSAGFLEDNLNRIKQEGIRPPTNCSACHY